MCRIRVLVEGQTEESFVNDVLSPYFASQGHSIYPILLRPRGGVPPYIKAQRDIRNSIMQDKGVFVTTFIDFYGMPNDWPGRQQAETYQNGEEKAKIVEEALMADVCEQMGESFNPLRFIPYVQLHEFEALLFADSSVLAQTLGEPKLEGQLTAIRQAFSTPEEINDNYETCPSRRIARLYPGYQKVLNGISTTKAMGLLKLRAECPHFNSWITKLESLAQQD